MWRFIFFEKFSNKIVIYTVGDNMDKKITVTFTESKNETERIQKITEILSEGVYACLKKQGLLRENPGRSAKIKLILEKTKPIITHEDEIT